MDKIKEMDQKIYDVLHPVYLKKNSRSTSAFKGYIIPSVENNFEVIEFIDTPGMEDSPFVVIIDICINLHRRTMRRALI